MAEDGLPLTRIKAGSGHFWTEASQIWRHRELLQLLTWRDIKVRYSQTVLGAAWAVVQPITTMLVFSIFFGALAGVPSDGSPYPVFVMTGLVPWQLFAYALSSSANSLISNERLVTRIYFPRILIPLSTVLAGMIDFGIALLVLLALLLFYGVPPGPRVILVPAFALLAALAAAAVGTGLAALNARFRDVRHTLPFLTQLWMLATPLAYPSGLVPPEWRAVYGLNPMVGVVEGFRWALLGQTRPEPRMVLVSAAVVGLGLLLSLVYFDRVQRTLPDVI